MFENVRRSSALDGLWVVALALVAALAGLLLMIKSYTAAVPTFDSNQCEIVCRPGAAPTVKG